MTWCLIDAYVLIIYLFSQLDGTIIAPIDSQPWGRGILQWLEFSKLKGITVQGKGMIDGRGSGWWGDAPYEDGYDDETKLIFPLNSTAQQMPPIPVITFIDQLSNFP